MAATHSKTTFPRQLLTPPNTLYKLDARCPSSTSIRSSQWSKRYCNDSQCLCLVMMGCHVMHHMATRPQVGTGLQLYKYGDRHSASTQSWGSEEPTAATYTAASAQIMPRLEKESLATQVSSSEHNPCWQLLQRLPSHPRCLLQLPPSYACATHHTPAAALDNHSL